VERKKDKTMKTTPPATEPLRVDVPEAARIIGVSRTRLYKHMKEGNIRSIKDGGRTLFTMAELRAFVARSEVT
jgi:excisionase family DNA binding protein